MTVSSRLRKAVKILIVLALAAVVPLTNLLVDPAGIFTTDVTGSVEQQAVDIMLSGSSAEGAHKLRRAAGKAPLHLRH